MKKFLKIALWILSFCFSGCLYAPLSNLVIEKKLFNQEGPIYQWLNTPKHTNLEFIIFIVVLVVFLLLGYLVICLYKYIRKNIKKNSPEEKLKKYNKVIDKENNFKITWDVYFDNNEPFASNIKLFCLNHAVPLLMSMTGCCDPDCPNAQSMISEHDLKRSIDSMLLAKYEFLKKISKK